MTLVFTICSNNYLAQALVLGESLLTFNKDYQFIIGLVDKKNAAIAYEHLPYDIVEVESLNIEGFEGLTLKYDITELNTAVKPFYFKYFFKAFTEVQRVIYLDPDIQVFSPFMDLEQALQNFDIVVTPHITQPINDHLYPTENVFLNAGIYNLGFIAVKKSENSLGMLDWWASRLFEKAYNDVKNGMFTDQLWINFVPVFFEKVLVFKHTGYNMAYWNLQERSYSQGRINNNEALAFFHFSGYSPKRSNILSKYQDRFNFDNRPDVRILFEDYANLLLANQFDYYQSQPCYYYGLKEAAQEKRVEAQVKAIPAYKRAVRKIINYTIKKFDIILDYRVFYER